MRRHGSSRLPELTRRFLLLARNGSAKTAIFCTNYNPDGSPRVMAATGRDGKPQVPIQEDETALVNWLWPAYERTRDLGIAARRLCALVVSAADFLVRFRDTETNLPLPSFDLMRTERSGVFSRLRARA